MVRVAVSMADTMAARVVSTAVILVILDTTATMDTTAAGDAAGVGVSAALRPE